jgi:hypothetical protein
VSVHRLIVGGGDISVGKTRLLSAYPVLRFILAEPSKLYRSENNLLTVKWLEFKTLWMSKSRNLNAEPKSKKSSVVVPDINVVQAGENERLNPPVYRSPFLPNPIQEEAPEDDNW